MTGDVTLPETEAGFRAELERHYRKTQPTTEPDPIKPGWMRQTAFCPICASESQLDPRWPCIFARILAHITPLEAQVATLRPFASHRNYCAVRVNREYPAICDCGFDLLEATPSTDILARIKAEAVAEERERVSGLIENAIGDRMAETIAGMDEADGGYLDALDDVLALLTK